MVPGARLVILGKQGAGKGTQCVRLARHYVVPHISTGDMFRAAVKSGTEFGQRARQFMDAGELIPDEVVVGVVRERLDQDDTLHRGFILDGFPRTREQAEALSTMLAPQDVDLAIDLEVDTEIVLRRLAGRRVCSTCGANYSSESPPNYDSTCDTCGGEVVQRDDDTEEAVARRLEVYANQTVPIIDFYENLTKLVVVNGDGDGDEVHERLLKEIDGRFDPARP